MATYKKKGHKPTNKEDQAKKFEEESTTAEVFNTLDEGANKTEAFVAKNQKYIYVIVGLAAVIILGYLGWQRFVQEPKELEAANEMFQAQQYFDAALAGSGAQSDSLYSMALNGGEGKYGFLDIIDEYSSTNAANLANYYAGFAYLNSNKYQEAIEYLEDFKSDDEILAPLAKGGIGDAFMQLDQPEEALSYYDEAASMRSNEFTAPRFLLKAALTAIELGKGEQAVKYLSRIKDEFPDVPEANQVPVYLGRAQAMK